MSDEKEINSKYYEDVVTQKSIYYDDTIKCLEIVKKFLIREQRILVGGMAIQMALKLKNPDSGIYDDNVLPDYDFYSPTHFKDAYNLAEWLYRVGFRNISVINAMHPSTMKVRVNFIVMADITHIPEHILEHMPTLKYKGFRIIHPHVQIIDQHRALSYPYENAPRETVMGKRPKNDMKRYDILYDEYPLRLLNIKDKSLELKEYTFPIEVFDNQCISGFFALNYWIKIATDLGFQSKNNFGKYSVESGMVKYAIPIDSHGITMYSDNAEELYKMLMTVYKNKKRNTESRFYNRFLDKLPRKVIIDNEFELLDNNQKISAHKFIINEKEIYIANLQNIMMYLMVNYILLMKIKNVKRGFSFYIGYLECRNLIQWVSGKYYNSTNNEVKLQLEMFFPTASAYGSKYMSDSYIVSKHNFDIKNREFSATQKYLYAQPSHIYDRDLMYKKVHKRFFQFNTQDSLVFDLDGEQTKPFF